MKKSHHLWRLLLPALLITLAVGFAPPAQAQDSRLVWSRALLIDSSTTLESVALIDANHAWAVGHDFRSEAGYALRLTFQGDRWQIEQMGSFPLHPLYAVSALGVDSAWAVGPDGYITRYDSTGWTQIASPDPKASLRAIQMLGDGSEGWAVGSSYGAIPGQSQPVALHYSGGRWTSAQIEGGPGGDTVASLHLGGGGGWAVGSNIWRLRDGIWQLERKPALCGGSGCGGNFRGVRAIDGERAFAVGAWGGICAACTSHVYLAERSRAGWGVGYADAGPSPLPPPEGFPETSYLSAISFTDASNGLAVGGRVYPHKDGSYGPESASIFGLRYADGAWTYEPILSAASETPISLSMADPSHALLVGDGGLLVRYGYGDQRPLSPTGRPTAGVPDPVLPGVAYFPEIRHSLRGVFRGYWERYGGLAQFGYPLTEEYREVSETDGQTYTVQYFERARFEYHPEYAGTRYEVLLGLLGHTVTADRAGEAAFLPAAPAGQAGSRYFSETGHSMAAEFVGYWEDHGGLAIYGYPISEPFYETNAADGKSYLVQYFERNRFEHHPEYAGTPYEVLLGLLGSEVLRAR